MFDTLFHRGWLGPFRELWPGETRFDEAFDLGTPRVDLIDREEEILVRAEVPGVDNTNAEFKDGILEIHLPKTHKTERRQIKVD